MFSNIKYILPLFLSIVNAYSSEISNYSSEPTSTPIKKIALEPIYGYAKSDIVFERVITLGQNCIPKGHVNAFFNPSQIDSRKTKKGQADLFDWMTIDDYDLFAKAALNKLDDFFEQQDFKIVHTWCELLVNKKYNMGWWHLFHSEFEGLNEDFTNVTEEKLII